LVFLSIYFAALIFGSFHKGKEHKMDEIICNAGCLLQKDAVKREKYLKSAWGKRYIKNRISDYLTG